MQRSKAFSVVRAASRFKVAFTLREGGKYADELDGASDNGGKSKTVRVLFHQVYLQAMHATWLFASALSNRGGAATELP